MTDEPIKDAIDALDDLLDEERKALLSGELDKIARLHDRKSKLIDELNQLDMQDQERMRTLSLKVGRNQELLNSALDGIRSVARRLAAVRRVRENLDTYDAQGQKQSIKNITERSLEKRA
jgi:flagellar biosynthesis/type III secretory pathway chaperone